MEIHEFNTFKFFRNYFHIPARIPLQWCLIRESSKLGDNLRLGILLKGTDRYIDVAMRRFFQTIDCPLIKRECSPAQRHAQKNDYTYISEAGWTLTKSKHYIRDIYFCSIFSEELIKTRLL